MKRFTRIITSLILIGALLLNGGVPATVNAAEAQRVGTVELSGNPSFDSDSIANSTANQWRWLSYPGARLSLNPNKFNPATPSLESHKMKNAAGPMSADLRFDLGGYLGAGKVQLFDVMNAKIAASGQAAGAASSVATTWYPYKINFQANYNSPAGTSVSGYDYFTGADSSVVRVMQVNGSGDKELVLGGTVSGSGGAAWDEASQALVVSDADYYYALKFVTLSGEDLSATGLSVSPVISGSTWSLRIPVGTDSGNYYAVGFGFSTSGEGMAKAVSRASGNFAQGVKTSIAATKQVFDSNLQKVPAPQTFGIASGIDAKGVTPDQHRMFYYGAFAFVLNNYMEILPENTDYFNYPQALLGKASIWGNGAPYNIGSCAWESFFTQQWLSYMMPREAWLSYEGTMSLVGEDGYIPGEVLPSRKAQTAWVIYKNGGASKEELREQYAHIKRNLLWLEQNPRWIQEGGHNYADEKDVEFMASFVFDVDFAIHIAQEIGEPTSEISMWEARKSNVENDIRGWFLNNPAKLNQYYYTGGKSYSSGVPESVLNAIVADSLTSVENQMLVDYWRGMTNASSPVNGQIFKYPVISLDAYAMYNKGFKGDAKQIVYTGIRDIIRSGNFTEVLNAKGELDGVGPSMFNAAAIIDFTLMANGWDTSSGQPRAIDLGDKFAESSLPAIEDFNYVSDWSVSSDANISTKNGIGTIAVNGNSSKTYGHMGKWVAYNVDENPNLIVKISGVGEGANWALKVNDGSSEVTLQSDTNKTGEFTYNLKEITKWSGNKSFIIKLYASGGQGKSFQADYLGAESAQAYEVVTDKQAYTPGQSITVSYKGAGSQDRIGIFKDDEQVPGESNPPLDVLNVTGAGEGTLNFDAKWSSGSYRAVLLKDGGYNTGASAPFKITEPPAPAKILVTGVISEDAQFSAQAVISPPSSAVEEYVLYWGDQKGKLASSQPIGVIQAGTGDVTYTFNKLPVPAGATSVLAYSRSKGTESLTGAEDQLPTKGTHSLTLEDFADVSDWTDQNNGKISAADGVGKITVASSSKSYGYVGKSVTVNVTDHPVLQVKIDGLDAGAKWSLKLNIKAGQSSGDIILQGDTDQAGTVTYDLRKATGWSGTKTFIVKFFAVGGQDKGFRLSELTARSALLPDEVAGPTIVAKNSSWAYLDNGTDPGTQWREIGFDDSGWKHGAAPLGYRGQEINTVVDYGSDSGNKHMTTYFRKEFQLEGLDSVKYLAAKLVRDDGAILYLNGHEIYRTNMPEGAVNSKTPALIGIGDERIEYSFNPDPSLLVNGKNVLAAEVHQNAGSSSDLYFSLELNRSEISPYLPISVAMSLNGSAKTNRGLAWYTKHDDPDNAPASIKKSFVDVIKADGSFDSANVMRFEGTSETVKQVVSSSENYISHKVLVEGLTPGTAYKYRVGSEGSWSETGYFTTEKEDEDEYEFLYMTDSQGSNTSDFAVWGSTLRQSLIKFPDAKFLIMPGDLVDHGELESEWLDYFGQAQDDFMNLPVLATIGNHDLRSGSQSFTYHFNLDNSSGTDSPQPGSVYSFDYGPAHFMVLNTGDIPWDQAQTESFNKQIEWLRKEATTTDKKWKIVAFHKAIYSVGNHSTDSDIAELREMLYPVFDELGIDVVLQGHDHTYVRSKQMFNNTPVTDVVTDENGNAINPKGTLYLINNAPGRKYYGIKSDAELNKDFAAIYQQPYKPVFTGIRMTDNSLSIQSYISGEAAPFDTYTIVRNDNGMLKTDKKVYTQGQTMQVSYKGASVSDQLGILKDDGQEPGESNPPLVVKNMEGNPEGAISFTAELEPGNYRVVLLHNGGYSVVSSVSFTIIEPAAPVKAELTGAVSDLHQLSGQLVITSPTTYVQGYALYWGDENGKLAGIDPIAVIPAGGSEAAYNFNKLTVPEGATSILVFSRSQAFESTGYASDLLPKAGLQPQILEDFVDVSDWTDQKDAKITAADGIGRVAIPGNSGYGYSGKEVTYNVTDLPKLQVKIEGLDSGTKWALKLRAPGSGDITFQGDTDQTGTLTYDIRKITGWKGSTTFTIKLFAVGSQGKGLSISELTAMPAFLPDTEPELTVPQAPAGVHAASGDGMAIIGFAAPEDNGGSEILKYVVTAWHDGIEAGTEEGTASPIIMGGLTNGETYTFTVTAVNAMGSSPASDPSNEVIPTADLPQIPVAPVNLSSIAGDGEVKLSWDGSADAVTYAVYGYEGTAAPAEPGDWRLISESLTGVTYTATGLTNGTSYAFAVKALNAAGESEFSNVTIAVPVANMPELPAAPQHLIGRAGNGSAALSWSPVAGANNYSVYLFKGGAAADSGAWELVHAGVAGTSYTVNGLMNGTSYSFAVKAVNEAGESTLSSLVVVTPVAPEDPSDPVTPGNGDNSGSTWTGGSSAIISTNGNLVLPSGRFGEVSLNGDVSVSLPVGASDGELQVTIEKLSFGVVPQAHQGTFVSSVYEMMKNAPGLFRKPVTIKMKFDPAKISADQRAAIFYYDEEKKEWVEVGGVANGEWITAVVDHFTKFAVLAVGEKSIQPELPVAAFTDIAGHWAENAIRNAAGKGLVNGYLDGTFKPNGSISRAEFTVMLAKAFDLKGTGSTLSFADEAKIGAWAKEAVVQAVEAGIVSGYEDGSFRPNERITRAEMTAMIARALKLTLNAEATTSFADDAAIPKWAKSAVEAIHQLGIVNGRGDGKFVPNETATRAEAITILVKLLEMA